ncbi:hypothetical protein ACR784_08040 [Sphingobacterium multivorum]|uniref:hypothetical protein n=1 Tax=Sphingobacterium TaxID=28453 RepID=UPI000E961122|nr:hypothetical protein [Sphingobacterium multivorum]HBI86779.1 hypothetical protein [Sphingobacterium sp.]
MLLNIIVGIVAYIILAGILSAKNSSFIEKTEYGLVYPNKLNKVYFLNILYVFVLVGYSYYVFSNQSGWSMYTMLVINFVFFISGFYINDEEEGEAED